MVIRNLVFPFCAAVLTAILVYKFRYLRSRWSNAKVWALCACVFFCAATMWSASPASAHWLNVAIGISNIAELVAAICVVAVAASFMVLALLWRYPAESAWPRVRWVVLGYALVVAAVSGLFAASSVPVERTVDFTFYYADQPTVAVEYSIYYISTLIGSAVLARWCFSWARHPDYTMLAHLRHGLRLYGGAGVVLAGYSLVRLVTMGANWFGTQALDAMGNYASMLAALLGCFFLTSALVVPVWGPRWTGARQAVHRWSMFRSLRSLHRSLQEVNPGAVFVAPGRRLDPQHRIRRTMIELSDWRWTLAPLFDPAVRDRVRRLGLEAGLTAEQLTTTVEAAQLRAALDAWRQGARSAAHTQEFQEERDGNDVHSEYDWWWGVASAFTRSAIVDQAVTAPPQPRSLMSGRLGRR